MLIMRARGVAAARERGATVVLAALLGSLVSWGSAAGQEVAVDVGDCVELSSAEARDACFAARVDAVLEEGGAEDSDEQPALDEPRKAEAEAEAETAAEAVEVEDEEDEEEYFGTIVAIREWLPNAYVITLDNGQVWQQIEPKRYPLRPGLEVRIYPTGWGISYRLHGLGTGGHIQVRRVE